MKEYIEREAVQEILKKYSVGTWRGIPSYPDEIRRASIDVAKIPAADVVERKRGEWIEHYQTGVAFCSECDCDAVENGTNFCPNCGADMRGEVRSMSEIKLHKRVKYAGDVHAELLKLGWDCETAALFCDNIPDADAVEVVRCKDCIHWLNEDGLEDHVCLKIYSDAGVHSVAWLSRKPDDFCSYGERRSAHGTESH